MYDLLEETAAAVAADDDDVDIDVDTVLLLTLLLLLPMEGFTGAAPAVPATFSCSRYQFL